MKKFIRGSTVGYKILSHSYKNQLCSCVTSGKAKVIYKRKVRNHAPRWLAKRGRYLTFFETIDSARNFQMGESLSGGGIWKIRANSILKKLPTRCLMWDLENGFIRRINDPWPMGTKMARSIILLKKMEDRR